MPADTSTSPPRPGRRRRRLILAAIASCIVLLAYGAWWLGSERALSYTGTGGLVPDGLSLLKPLDASDYFPASDAPPSYGWHRGGEVFASFVFHNSLSVPVTITGVDHPPPDETWLLAGPELRRPRPGVTLASAPGQTRPAGSVHVGAGQDVELDLLWRAVDACTSGQVVAGSPGGSWTGVQSIRIRYQVLPFITHTQTVSIASPVSQPEDGLPGEAFDVAAPVKRQCPAGYPHPVNTAQRVG